MSQNAIKITVEHTATKTFVCEHEVATTEDFWTWTQDERDRYVMGVVNSGLLPPATSVSMNKSTTAKRVIATKRIGS